MRLTLPSRANMASAIDHGTAEDYHLVRLYYSWYAGWLYRHRLDMIANLLGQRRYDRALDVGVGSGIFIKEMLAYADFVSGVDIHNTYDGVRAMLEKEGVDLARVDLRQGSIFDLPYGDKSFDAVVCISVLEHFADPRPALLEMSRVVRPDGWLVLGFPARNTITDVFFRLVGYDAREIHPASHKTILAAVRDLLPVDVIQYFPSRLLPLYIACRTRKIV
jgi:ubiquinone/menaquinone biosynthesis C-methylase UbiE